MILPCEFCAAPTNGSDPCTSAPCRRRRRLLKLVWAGVSGTILALMLHSVLAAPAQAQDYDLSCSQSAGFVEELARNYQAGISLSHTLELIATLPTESLRQTGRALTLMVYSGQRYLTPAMQEQAIAEVRNQVHLACLQG